MRVLNVLLAAALLAGGCGASASYQTGQASGWSDSPSYAFEGESIDGEMVVMQTASVGRASSESRSSRRESPPPAPPMAAGAPAPITVASGPGAPIEAPVDDVARPQPLLIYTAQITLAIYDVRVTQDAALAAIEQIGGYASDRNNNSITFRVPAERFRETLDVISGLGDVLALDWQASDVSEQYRDLDIRLQNAIEMHGRLTELLARATEVQDMLYIEQQLERITLEIERIRGQLRVLADQIAYSTITVYFNRRNVTDVPTNEFRLPFPWLNSLGLERLLAM